MAGKEEDIKKIAYRASYMKSFFKKTMDITPEAVRQKYGDIFGDYVLGIYGMYINGHLVYIGLSKKNICTRIEEHYRDWIDDTKNTLGVEIKELDNIVNTWGVEAIYPLDLNKKHNDLSKELNRLERIEESYIRKEISKKESTLFQGPSFFKDKSIPDRITTMIPSGQIREIIRNPLLYDKQTEEE